jgi:Thiamine pyrophosphate enzyme, N-terminal TPP binding domain
MGAVGFAALAANAASFGLLWAHRGGDANMRSAWICTRNDVLGNLADFGSLRCHDHISIFINQHASIAPRLTYEEESMSEVDGATLIARSLKQQGIDHLFGVVGFPVTPIAAAAQKEGVAYIGMRNEQAASYAAQAYGYLTGRPGACIVVTGPGVVHGLAGLANAQQNCWPMILFGGASETYRGGMGAFQEERQVLIASPFCKFAHGIESVQRRSAEGDVLPLLVGGNVCRRGSQNWQVC